MQQISGVAKLNSDEKFSRLETDIEIMTEKRTKTGLDCFSSINDGCGPISRSPLQIMKFQTQQSVSGSCEGSLSPNSKKGFNVKLLNKS
jgi:hypothetical protein